MAYFFAAMELSSLDQIIFGLYIIGVIIFGIWIANRDRNATSSDYFLASRSLPWWAVGGSLIASNISTEQIMGMNGSGFALGLAIGTYELMAAITLIIVAKFLLPVFIKKGIFTMPQFLEERFDGRVRTIMSVFWIGLFVFVNIATVLFLGGLAVEELLGYSFYVGVIGLLIYSASFSIFGGLKAVVWTDFIQVVVLLIGGTVAAAGILGAIGDGSVFTGISNLIAAVGDHFEMLFEPTDTYTDIGAARELAAGIDGDGNPTSLNPGDEIKSSYQLLPGVAVLFGGMWIVNTYYWGNNQYIIQRALAAKDLKEAQKGVAFAAFLKLFIPFFAVLPGIAVWYISQGHGPADLADPNLSQADKAFPHVLANYVAPGLKGLTFAALIAAIGSSVSSMVNSASTIFTLDIYQKHIDPTASESKLVRIGQISAAAALLIGAVVSPALKSLEQVFQYIQEYTGFVSPGVFAVFVFGMFWRRTTSTAALAGIVLSIPLSLLFKFAVPDLPFLDRMAFVFIIIVLTMMSISLAERRKAAKAEAAGTDSTDGGRLIADSRLRLGLAIGIVMTGVATGIRMIFDKLHVPVDVAMSSPPYAPIWVPIVILVLSLGTVFLLLTDNKSTDDPKAIDLEPGLFRTQGIFNLSAVAIILILVAIYATFP
ncbi:MAG: sodium/solute symporter [Bacteroidota bacterium]